MNRQLEILILDDEEIVCTRLKPALVKDGYRVETFTDSLLAKQRIDEKRYDIVITDLKMEGLDGMQLFQIVKEKWPDTRVIIISGFTTVEIARQALKAGVRDIISKPFKISRFKELIAGIAAEINASGDQLSDKN